MKLNLLSLFKKKRQVNPQTASENDKNPEENIERAFQTVEIRVAGVTFKNGSRSRQDILRQIAKKQPPYDGCVAISFRPTEYEGEPAVEIWTNDEHIGYVPKEQLPTFYKWAVRPYDVHHYEVHGGGKAYDGSNLNYGMRVVVHFLKEGQACDWKELHPPMLPSHMAEHFDDC